jgi:tape measure domain-containing protein
MANELDYVLRMNATAFTGPLRGALSSVRDVDGATRQMGVSVDGMRTSMVGAGNGASGLFDKLAHLGGNLANVVGGVKAGNEVFGFFKNRMQGAGTAATAMAAQTTAAAATTATLGTAGSTAGLGLVALGAGATGAAAGIGAVILAAAPLIPILIAVAAALKTAQVSFGAFKKGIGLANEMEQLNVSFKAVLGSAASAQALLGAVRRTSEETGDSFQELTKAARTLLTAVPEGALAGELKAISTIAKVTGGDLQGLAKAYSQVASAGRVQGDELEQFVDQGAGVIKRVMAEVMGVSNATFKKMTEDGKVGFSVLQEAVQRLGGETGKWSSALVEAQNANNNLWSKSKSNVSEILRMLASPIADGPLKQVLQTLEMLTRKARDYVAELTGNVAVEPPMPAEPDWAKKNDAVTEGDAGGGTGSKNKTDEAAAVAASARRLKAEMAILQARATGNTALAAFLQTELDTAELAGKIYKETQKSAAESWRMAREKLALEEAAGKKDADTQAQKGFAASIDAMKKEVAIMEARATGQKALADAMQADLDIRREAADISRATGASDAEALSIAQRRWAAQKGINAAVAVEAAAKAQKETEDAAGKKASGQMEALNLLKAEMAILQAKATGQGELADQLQRELGIRQEAKRIAESTGLAEEKALQLARKKAGLEEQANKSKSKNSRYDEDGRRLTDGRKKIQGFSRDRAGLRPFGGLSEFYGMQRDRAAGVRVGQRFRGIQPLSKAPGLVPPGVASKRQARKEAEAAAARAIEPRWDLVEAIDQKLAGLGLV